MSFFALLALLLSFLGVFAHSQSASLSNALETSGGIATVTAIVTTLITEIISVAESSAPLPGSLSSGLNPSGLLSASLSALSSSERVETFSSLNFTAPMIILPSPTSNLQGSSIPASPASSIVSSTALPTSSHSSPSSSAPSTTTGLLEPSVSMCFDNDKLTTTPCSALGPVTSPLGGGAPGKLHAAEFGFWIGVILGGLLFSGVTGLL